MDFASFPLTCSVRNRERRNASRVFFFLSCSRSILTARAGRLHHHARLTNIFITYACAENDDSYVLRADLPGMKKEDVNVELDGQIVRISATKKDTKKWEEEGYKYHRA